MTAASSPRASACASKASTASRLVFVEERRIDDDSAKVRNTSARIRSAGHSAASAEDEELTQDGQRCACPSSTQTRCSASSIDRSSTLGSIKQRDRSLEQAGGSDIVAPCLGPLR